LTEESLDLGSGREILCTTRDWTLSRVENTPDGKAARLHVHEEPGFQIDLENGAAHYYQFPRDTAAGPHRFTVSQLARDPRWVSGRKNGIRLWNGRPGRLINEIGR
jgi:hypothetical protein